MKIIESTDRKLVVEDFSWRMGAVFGSSSLYAIWKISGIKFSNLEDILGPFLALAMMLLATALLTYRTRFDFDLDSKKVKWFSKRITGFKGGEFPLSDIGNVVIQGSTAGNSNNVPTYSITIEKTDGSKIPLSPAYIADEKGNTEAIEKIRELLTMDTDISEIKDQSVESMVADGRIVDAIKMVRNWQGVSLTDAHNIIKEIEQEQLRNAPITKENIAAKKELSKGREQLIVEGKLVRAINVIMKEDGVSRAEGRKIIKEIKKRKHRI